MSAERDMAAYEDVARRVRDGKISVNDARREMGMPAAAEPSCEVCGDRRDCPSHLGVPCTERAPGSRPDLDRLPPGALPARQLARTSGPGTGSGATNPPPARVSRDTRPDSVPAEDALRADVRAARWREDALDMLAAGEVPPGDWRVGGHCPRSLYIGPPRPYGVDVGRMDSPELAAYVVEAVNERDRATARADQYARDVGTVRAEVEETLSHWQERADKAAIRAGQAEASRDVALAERYRLHEQNLTLTVERDRLRAALIEIRDAADQRAEHEWIRARADDVLEATS